MDSQVGLALLVIGPVRLHGPHVLAELVSHAQCLFGRLVPLPFGPKARLEVLCERPVAGRAAGASLEEALRVSWLSGQLRRWLPGQAVS
jgi:hypothetical protein